MSLTAVRSLLACPHCGETLEPDGARWHCPAGHSFDVARPGYLNLCGAAEPANADTPAMLAARQRVLASGLFAGVTDALHAAAGDAVRLLEVGAGTAHHLAALVDRGPAAAGLAVDVSRAAARRAARAHARVGSVVADVWRRLPVPTGTLDVVLCVFAPRNPAEFARVLGPSGRLVIATPTRDHLSSLRTRYGLLDVPDDKHGELVRRLAPAFTPTGSELVRHRTAASAELVADLIGMGPNAFHGVPAATAAMAVEVAVRVTEFRRGPAG